MALGVSPRILCAQAGPPGGAGEISQHPTTRVCGGGVCVGAEAMAAAPASHVASEMKTTAVQCPKTRATSQEARGSGAGTVRPPGRQRPSGTGVLGFPSGIPDTTRIAARDADAVGRRPRGRVEGVSAGACGNSESCGRPPDQTSRRHTRKTAGPEGDTEPSPSPDPRHSQPEPAPDLLVCAPPGGVAHPAGRGEGSGGLRPPKPGENANVRQPPKVQTTVGSARCAHLGAALRASHRARAWPGRGALREGPGRRDRPLPSADAARSPP